MYAALAPAGFGPREIDGWLPYQLMACYTGLARANTPPDDDARPGAPSYEQWVAAHAPGVN